MLRLSRRVRLRIMLPFHRLKSTSMVFPDKIFKETISPPLSWSALPLWRPYQESPLKTIRETGDKMLPFALDLLQESLRSLHKQKIAWPVEESDFPNLAPNEYLSTLLCPIADIFNQLHAPGVLESPMKYEGIAFGESTYGGTFVADDFKEDGITAPIVICLRNPIFDTAGKVSYSVECAVYKVFESYASAPSIIVSNFTDIVVFSQASDCGQLEVVFERVSTKQPALALRVISSALLLRELYLTFRYIKGPEPTIEVDMELIGPPNDPNRPLLEDEEVLMTHRRHSDFDFVTLIHDRPRALQFFRWHDLLRERYSKVVAHTDDVLAAETNNIGPNFLATRPLYPYDASELPLATVAHLKAIRRDSPLTTCGIQDLFKQSKSFVVKIEAVLSEGTRRGISTVYRCHLISIDGHPVLSPSLCLKLFDDRFQQLALPDEDDFRFQDKYIPCWFEALSIAELHALNETFAYDKLLPAQGTVVPWFYGIHQFKLPDDTPVYGLLMEYIDGGDLESGFGKNLSTERQIDFICSCRHAVRVLDVADVSQRDWHTGQILLHTNHTTKIDHVVLIDLASTTQTWDADVPNLIANYFGVFNVLVGKDVPFDYELIWEHFGMPDDWDPICALMRRYRRDDSPSVVVKAGDMFPFISCI